MALRRLAQANAAASAPTTPAARPSPAARTPAARTPAARTPAAQYRSPASTPSISSSVPFDWDAARAHRPPPYATPPHARPRKSAAAAATPPRRVVRKKSLAERLSAIPARIAFEIAVFPTNVPRPAPATSARLIGAALHLSHLAVRIAQVRAVADADLGWEDLSRERDGAPWFDWTVPATLVLVAAAVLNAASFFARVRTYRLHHRTDPVPSPNAAFVPAPGPDPPPPPPLPARLRAAAWAALVAAVRFLLGRPPPPPPPAPTRVPRVQELAAWDPAPLEAALFAVYSPAHALLWAATGPSNWILMLLIMALVGAQLHALARAHTALLKDKDILAAEVMHEYNEGFVYPRINPVRHDVAVMTHQSEVVNVWED